MFDHVTIRVADRAASEAFYNTVLEPLGIDTTYSDARFAEWDDFSLTAADAEHPVDARAAHRLRRARRASSSRPSGAPARRRATATTARRGRGPQYRDDYYGGFLLDPDGNSAEAVHHADDPPARPHRPPVDPRRRRRRPPRPSTTSSRPMAASSARATSPTTPTSSAPAGSFSLVAGTPTENLHVAFPAPENAAVDAFHRAAMEAGYRDNGAPGERPRYHPGYYGAVRARPRRQQHRARQPQPLGGSAAGAPWAPGRTSVFPRPHAVGPTFDPVAG